jgi:hypothetical protein
MSKGIDQYYHTQFQTNPQLIPQTFRRNRELARDFRYMSAGTGGAGGFVCRNRWGEG